MAKTKVNFTSLELEGVAKFLFLQEKFAKPFWTFSELNGTLLIELVSEEKNFALHLRSRKRGTVKRMSSQFFFAVERNSPKKWSILQEHGHGENFLG